MDTILYFYINRTEQNNFQPYSLEKYSFERYVLVRVGLKSNWLDGLDISWAVKWIKQEQDKDRGKIVVDDSKRTQHSAARTHSEEKTQHRAESYLTPMGLWKQRRARKIKKRQEEEKRHQEEMRYRQEEARIKRSMEELKKLWNMLIPLTDSPLDCYAVYEEGVRRKEFSKIWQYYSQMTEFKDYPQQEWSGYLLERVLYPDYIFLGYSAYLPGFLWHIGNKMKSLFWVLPASQYTEEFQEMEENFYLEFGLAIKLCQIANQQEYQRIALQSKSPVNIIDFSGTSKLQNLQIPNESIWLDMTSCDAKQVKLEGMGRNFQYFSLKKQWKEMKKQQHRVTFHAKQGGNLDTMCKNGYNT